MPGYDIIVVVRLRGAGKTPARDRAEVQADTVAVLSEPAIKERLDKLGVIIVGSTAAELAAHLKREMDRWEPVIKRANIKVNE